MMTDNPNAKLLKLFEKPFLVEYNDLVLLVPSGAGK